MESMPMPTPDPRVYTLIPRNGFGDDIDHCRGLALGRSHALCDGNEAGADPNDRYPMGEIGGFGFSIETNVPPRFESARMAGRKTRRMIR
jgi:hypothetical protein